jgi:predicted nucleic acid-binding protein
VRVFVVDASLVVKWLVPEVHSEAARRWLEVSHDYIAPDLVFPEAGNAIWKKIRRRELHQQEGQRLVADMSAIGVEAVSMRALLPDAHALAVATGVTVYDAMYLTLAVRLETQVITADDRFVRRIAEHALLAPHIRSVEDFVSE